MRRKPRTLVILAAGEGKRLLPLTAELPKCMVPFKDKPLLHWQVEAARAVSIERIVVVTGYREEKIHADGILTVPNPRFGTTNMVESLWCARSYFDDEVTVSYGDILYEPGVLRELWDDPRPSAVIVDTAWREYWATRFDDILADAESLRIDSAGRITSIGQKETSLDNIQAQYIGLFRLGREALDAAETIRITGRPRDPMLPGWIAPPRSLEKWYMTDLLHAIAHSGVPLQAVPIEGRWLEVDSMKDLALGEESSALEGSHLRIRH